MENPLPLIKEKISYNAGFKLENSSNRVDINISAVQKLLLFLFLILFALNLLSISLIEYNSGRSYGLGKFHFDREDSFPTYFSSVILFFSAVVLSVITVLKTRLKNRYSKHWLMLSLIFVFMSIDETIGIHEMLTEPVRLAFNLSGYFRFSWVLPGLVVIIFLFFTYFKFLRSLPASYRNGFLLSCAIYITGAVGFEMIGANLYDGLERPQKDLYYNLAMTMEESLEMMGVLLFISKLLSYLKSLTAEIRLNLI